MSDATFDLKNSFESLNSIEINGSDYSPLAEAIRNVLKNEQREVIATLMTKDIVPVAKRTKDNLVAVKDFGVKTVKYFGSIKKEVKEEGWSKASLTVKGDAVSTVNGLTDVAKEKFYFIKNQLPVIKTASIKFVDRVVSDYNACESDNERIKYVSKLLLYSYLIKSGFDFGNALPDSDFALWGAGAHRSFLSHSAIPAIGVGIVGCYIFRVLERAETKLESGTPSKELCEVMKNCALFFTASFGAGFAFHMLKDTFVDTGGTIRFHNPLDGSENFGSMVGGTKVDDMAYTAVNAFLSSFIAEDNIKKTQT